MPTHKCLFCGTSANIDDETDDQNCRNCGGNILSDNSSYIHKIRTLLRLDAWAGTLDLHAPVQQVQGYYSDYSLSVTQEDLDAVIVANRTSQPGPIAMTLIKTLGNLYVKRGVIVKFFLKGGAIALTGFVLLKAGTAGIKYSTEKSSLAHGRHTLYSIMDNRTSLMADTNELSAEIEELSSIASDNSSIEMPINDIISEGNALVKKLRAITNDTQHILNWNFKNYDQYIETRVAMNDVKYDIEKAYIELQGFTGVETAHNLNALAKLSSSTKLPDTDIDLPYITTSSLSSIQADINSALFRGDVESVKTNINKINALNARVDTVREVRSSTFEKLDHLDEIAATDEAKEALNTVRAKLKNNMASADTPLAPVMNEVDKLSAIILDTYTLRIVNRDNKKSGVWRYHDAHPNVKNFYLVVEADGTSNGENKYIRNEENGLIEYVDSWGVRVSEDVYNKVGEDKAADGIIDNDKVGIKHLGHLTPVYTIETTGGTITAW